jgi:uncharacterized protein YdbL (DUF1318 family)
MRRLVLLRSLAVFWLALVSITGWAQANLEINTPAIQALQSSLAARYEALRPFYNSGAIGLTRDGLVTLRDAGAVPLPQRQAANRLVAEQNRDLVALYREIARANGHPEWERDIQMTFGQRWIAKAQPGWYYQNPAGQWVRK